MPKLQGYTNHNGATWIYVGIFIGIFMIYQIGLRWGIIPTLLIAGIPFALLCITQVLQKLTISFYLLFIASYLIMGVNRYYSMKSGMMIAVLVFGLLFIVLLQNSYQQLEWKRSRNLLVAFWSIWFLYCFMELFNPMALLEPWYISIMIVAFFPLAFAVIVPILLRNWKDVRWLLVIWAILSLFAAAKGYWQKNHGFDSTELNWLYNEGGAKTHLIHSGIRFFSFFSDAANFGSSMGLTLVTLGISGFYVKAKWMKILFWTAALAGGYGLLISGTRSAIAVPFFGFAYYAIACKNIKGILISALLVGGAFVLLNYTTIGDSNRYIKRMRTAFDNKDASFMVRSYNKQKIYHYMLDKPFGVGLGLGGGKAKRFMPDSEIAQVPTDSYLVMLWVETGIVGLLMYLTLIALIIYKGTQIAIKEIQHKELRGILLGMLGGICGIFITSYANEVLLYPNCIIIYTFMGIIFAAQYYDKELTKNERIA